MGTHTHRHSRHIGNRIRAALVGASALYVVGLLLITARPLGATVDAPGGIPTAAALPAAVPAPAQPPAPPVVAGDGLSAGDFLPQLQINGRGIVRRPDF